MTGLVIWRWVLDIGWLCFLSILFWHFWRDRQVLVQSQTWLKAKGRITSCEWTKVGHSVWPKIEYTYQVHERDLVGEYLFLDTAHNNPHSKYARQIAYRVAVAFKEHQEIDVYYNPNHPEQSALDVSVPKKLNFILIFIGILMLLQIGLMVLRFLH